MANNSGEKIRWQQIDAYISEGWYVLKLDGSGFKSLRTPNLHLESVSVYYEIVVSAAKETMDKFHFLEACYVIDDEFHFLFHSSNVPESKRRISKLVVLPATFISGIINSELKEGVLKSRLPINFHRLCYDGRLMKIGKRKIIPYFNDIINHGKMFIGNNVVGQGKYFVHLDEVEIVEKAKEKKFLIKQEHSKLLGVYISKHGVSSCVNNLKIDDHKNRVFSNLRKIPSEQSKD